jgi:hypothetical protein
LEKPLIFLMLMLQTVFFAFIQRRFHFFFDFRIPKFLCDSYLLLCYICLSPAWCFFIFALAYF